MNKLRNKRTGAVIDLPLGDDWDVVGCCEEPPRPCPPPERWRDVTSECEWNSAWSRFQHCGALIRTGMDCRVRKVKRWSQCTPTQEVDVFIIEKRITP